MVFSCLLEAVVIIDFSVDFLCFDIGYVFLCLGAFRNYEGTVSFFK